MCIAMSKSMECLIIDDDLDDQEIFLMCVQELNRSIHCLTSNSGVEAISMLSSDTDYIPDFIFIDVNMPKMNGINCLGILKNMERLRSSKFYMYSTTSERSALESSRSLGADDFIIKPVKIAALKERLEGIFSGAAPHHSNKAKK
jgi:CheY-like chemotaxis protein